MIKRIISVALLLVLVVSFLAYGAVTRTLVIPESSKTISVEPGATLSRLAADWEKDGWLPSAKVLLLMARFGDYASKIKPGEYEVNNQMISQDLLELLVSGKSSVRYKVSLIEGRTVEDVISRLKDSGLVQDVDPLTRESLAELLNIEGNPEGWIYPDTYVYQKGDKVSDVLRQAYARTQSVLDEEWSAYQERIKNNLTEKLPYESPYDVLIMASLVEKETGQASERPEIAGVFVRRLRNNMRLETDPTIIYGLGPSFDGNLRRIHLKDKNNPYNTYRHKGLTPTPIAAPGRAAIKAALSPDNGTSLYFVAKGDGSHYFSDTYKEHQNAVNRYQRFRRAKNYRSAPGEQK